MKLLNTYDTKDEGEAALAKIDGPKRLASERDSTEIIYNLFGQATWSNFHTLDMFNLPELKKIISLKQAGSPYNQERHIQIIKTLEYVATSFDLITPKHWL